MKTLAAAACLTLSAVATADAQPRPFRDAWFWGVHGGMTSYSGSSSTDPSVSSSSVAPQLGLDWLITRQHGGLYVSFNQAFLTTTASVINGPTSADTGFRVVDVKNLRRFNLAAMAFPGDFVRLHPYVGGGFAFGYLGAAQPQFSITDTDRQEEFAASAVNDTKAGIGPLFIAGAQYRMRGLSVFGQFTAAAMSRDFMLAFGNPVSLSTEFGVRYNIGSSIAKDY